MDSKNNDTIEKLKSKDFINPNTKDVLKELAMKLRRISQNTPLEIESSAIIDLNDVFNSAVAIELFCSILFKEYKS